MTSPDLYQKHIDEVAPGTQLLRTMNSSMSGWTTEEFFAVMKWELWECIMSLPPMSAAKGEKTNSGEPTKISDPSHASACASRVESMLERLRALLKAGR